MVVVAMGGIVRLAHGRLLSGFGGQLNLSRSCGPTGDLSARQKVLSSDALHECLCRELDGCVKEIDLL